MLKNLLLQLQHQCRHLQLQCHQPLSPRVELELAAALGQAAEAVQAGKQLLLQPLQGLSAKALVQTLLNLTAKITTAQQLGKRGIPATLALSVLHLLAKAAAAAAAAAP
jgi:hypothetical protein